MTGDLPGVVGGGQDDPDEADERPRVVVVGPGPRSAGGVWAVIRTVLSSPLTDRFQFQLIPTHRDGSWGTKLAAAVTGIGQIGRALVRDRPDLLWIHTASGFSLRRKMIVALLARLGRTPYVIHVHGAEMHLWYARITRPERALVRYVMRSARLVIALSSTWEERLRAIAPCETAAIMNPVAVPPRPPADGAVPGRIVAVGRLGDRKGSRVLVRSVAMLRDCGVPAHLHLAGDGDHAAVAAEVRRLSAEDLVTLHSWLTPDGVAELLHSAAIFALPSRDEGLPVALLEAMAHGLPVVVTPVGGIPDLVEESVHGLFVRPDDPEGLADALARLVADPEEGLRMGVAARATVEERCSLTVVADQLEHALRRALDRPEEGSSCRQ